MKKKSNTLIVKTFRGEEYSFASLKGKADKQMLRNVFQDKEIEEIEKDFEQFFKLVYDNCNDKIDKEGKKLLKDFKEELQSFYFMNMSMLTEFSPFRYSVNVAAETIKYDALKGKKGRENVISYARQALFFLSDIVIAFVMGNDENLIVIKERYVDMTAKKIKKEKLDVLIKIKSKQDELIQKYGRGQKASKNNAIIEAYKTLSVEEKRILLNIKSGTKVPDELTENRINTISTQLHRHT